MTMPMRCESVGPMTGFRCEREKDHGGNHYRADSTGGGESWCTETCGAIFPFTYPGMPKIKGMADSDVIRCNLYKNHGGDTHSFRTGLLPLYQWPVSPAPDPDDDATDAMIREGMKRLAADFPSVIEYNEAKMSEAELAAKCQRMTTVQLTDWLMFEATGPFCNSPGIRARIIECTKRLLDHKEATDKRRERIATKIMAGMATCDYSPSRLYDFDAIASDAVDAAAALIAELDRADSMKRKGE